MMAFQKLIDSIIDMICGVERFQTDKYFYKFIKLVSSFSFFTVRFWTKIVSPFRPTIMGKLLEFTIESPPDIRFILFSDAQLCSRR